MIDIGSGTSCSGIGCCQSPIPSYLDRFVVLFDDRFNQSQFLLPDNLSGCSFAMVMEDDAFVFNTTYITTKELLGKQVPIVLDWFVGGTDTDSTCVIARTNQSTYLCKSHYSDCTNSSFGSFGYLCNCSLGYEGNPYLEGGCQGLSVS
jgi:hypothetical protein